MKRENRAQWPSHPSAALQLFASVWWDKRWIQFRDARIVGPGELLAVRQLLLFDMLYTST